MRLLGKALTFDDVLLAPAFSQMPPKAASLARTPAEAKGRIGGSVVKVSAGVTARCAIFKYTPSTSGVHHVQN